MVHLENGGDPDTAAFKLDVHIGVLRQRSVAWFVTAWDTINNRNLILKAWEQCKVDNFNLLHACVTSAEALGALLDLQDLNPALYQEIMAGGNDDLAKDAAPAADAATVDESPFADDGNDEHAIDTSEYAADYVNHVIFGRPTPSASTPSADAPPAPLAEELEPGEVEIPALRRGKRQKVMNTRYKDGFDAH